MGMSALDRLIKNRDGIPARITWIKNQVAAATDLVGISQHITDAEKVKDRIMDLFEKIGECASTDMGPHELVYNTQMTSISDVILELKRKQAPLLPTPGSSSSSTSSGVRLPRIELPSFNGNLTDWMSFRELFKAAVDSNTQLTKAQKFTYLYSCMKGDATKLLKSMDATDANYDSAWDLLKSRYQNEREIFFAILKRFMNQQTMNEESASGLRSMVDVSKECIRAVKNLGAPVEHWGGILVFLIIQKLDPETRKAWELSLKTTDLPVLEDLFKFLEQQARGLSAEKPQKKLDHGKKVQVHFASSNKCEFCSREHLSQNCRKFQSMSAPQRLDEAKRLALCFSCLGSGHRTPQCTSKTVCRDCKRSHNTLLHLSPAEFASIRTATPVVVSNHSHHEAQLTNTILATAVVQMPDQYGQLQLCRALLDGGSTSSFISEACVQKLGLRRMKTSAEIVGVGSTAVGRAKGAVKIRIQPHFQEVVETTHEVTALIMKKVTGRLPVYPCDSTPWPHLKGLLLADPTYYKPGDVDLLLGADVFWDLLLDGKKKGNQPGSPIGLRTTLGWLVAGNVNSNAVKKAVIHFADVTLEEQLQKFWELETVPEKRVLTQEERECEAHFDSTVTRDDTGRFVVQLPFKKSELELGTSREIAVRRLKQLERRLEKNPEYRSEYHKFMDEYHDLGHMEVVPAEEAQSSQSTCYIPHHFVLKESSTTTKFRVVFDASAKTSSGISLNEKLMVGPTLQETLVSILTRFRTHVVAFTADIAKMYRQIRMSPVNTDMQRIVWRNNPNEPIQDYRLLTATYGTASAPYHATKVLQRLAEEEKETLPLAHDITVRDFYMDDVMSGGTDELDAINKQQELLELMRRGGLNLRKWSSNSAAVLEALPRELRETQLPLRIDLDEVIKTLGLRWNPASDEFSFKVNLSEITTGVTKRKMLSEMAKVFDPLGWLAPSVIRSKIMFQKLWKTDGGWDDPLPHQVNEDWLSYRAHLPSIEDLKIPRCCMPTGAHSPQLFGFCDASEQAYAAVIYLRVSLPTRGHLISLLAARTRVAPSKQISLPRLELCGALLLAQLSKAVQEALKIPNLPIRAWTDSTVVLAWLKAVPTRWQTFVANRVSQIQDIIPAVFWNHVKGLDNPADCASRGIDPVELVNHPLWWKGPRWLLDDDPCPFQSSDDPDADAVNREEKKLVRVHTVVVPESSILFAISSLKKLKRITALCLRFVNNCKARVNRKENGAASSVPSYGLLSANELDTALMAWVKTVQTNEFSQEVQSLLGGKCVSGKSKLRNLNPFLDSVQILRVGGRLRHAKLPADQKTPIILPRHHKLTELIIQHEHQENLHAGAQLLLSVLLRRFWIVGAKDAVRHQIKKCVTCTRHGQSAQLQFMGDLPESRVTPARAFLKCGLDYAGPFTLRAIPSRSKVTFKAYLCLFVCYTTRALHLEVVSSLETEAFLSAFRRFIARRGKPTDVFSDCGTNFVGAVGELKEMKDVVQSNVYSERVAAYFANEGVQWHFNPPSAPHFGGLWEAGVKSVKMHLWRVIGKTRLTFEELTTIMCQIEACLNSRPLTPMSTDPSDLAALTPGNFLIGDSLRTIPEPDLTMEKINRLSRCQLAQQLTQQFWSRWSSEYLTRLQQRPKWLKHRTDVQMDDMVLVKDERLPPLQWQMGRIVATHPGPDGHTRVVTVKTMAGEFKRPIVKLCLLPIDPAVRKSDDNILNEDII